MPNEMRLLVVEDNEGDQAVWERVIERHNAALTGNTCPIRLLTASDITSAEILLTSSYIDAAVIDLRLDGNGRDPDNSAGNDVLLSVLSKKLAVVAVFTGQPADARIPEFAAAQVKVFTKGGDDNDGIAAVMTWLSQQSSLVKCIQDASDAIRTEMATVFNRSIWPRWKNWIEGPDAANRQFLSSSVARHIVSHVHEILTDTLDGSAHAEEWYLLPPSSGEFRTGDIVRTGNVIEIVVTPRCDIATKKFKNIQLARCEDIATKWNTAVEKNKQARGLLEQTQAKGAQGKELTEAEEQARRTEGKLGELSRHDGNKSAAHFLPRMKLSDGSTMGPLLVRFDSLRSLDKNDKEVASLRNAKIAAVAPAFLPTLVERLGAFFSRIGSPDYYHFEE